MELAAITLVAYLIGSFPTGVVLSRRKYGIDVREMGSGNIGATNITRTFGWYAGAVTFLIDGVKGFLPLALVQRFGPPIPFLVTGVGLALVAGHCFSAFLKLRGGKGVATSFGCLLAVDPRLALAAGATYGVGLAVSRISAVGSLSAIAASLLYVVLAQPPSEVAWLTVGICFLVVFRHQSNIRRLVSGSPLKKGSS